MSTATVEIDHKANTYTAFEDLFDSYRYPAGETHVALTDGAPLTADLIIEARVTSFDDLAQVITADRVLHHNGAHARWFVPYFPFARHDRRNHMGDGFELGLALDMVRELDIMIADPHSDVAGQLAHITQEASVACFRTAGVFDDDPVIIIPDSGATKKAHTWATGRIVQAMKHRDPATGRLSGFEVLADDLAGAPCVIVDDICDGGGTFLGLAKELSNKNAGPITLAVTHGLFTKGTEQLAGAFDRIVTFSFAADTPTAVDGDVTYLPFSDLYTEALNNQGARR